MRKLENEKMGWRLQETRQRKGLTLPKVRAAQAKTLAKYIPLKGTLLSYRKETKKNGREPREVLVKKCY